MRGGVVSYSHREQETTKQEEMKMNKTKMTAINMMNANSAERKEAEKMMGCKFDEMTVEQRQLAAICLAAFDGAWNNAK